VVSPDGEIATPMRTRADPALVKALARAFRWQRLLDEGRYASVSEMARAERIERGYLGRVLRLALLPPDVIEAVLNGKQGADLNLPTLLDSVPLLWSEQRRVAANRAHRALNRLGPLLDPAQSLTTPSQRSPKRPRWRRQLASGVLLVPREALLAQVAGRVRPESCCFLPGELDCFTCGRT
jgi:hypothetical protein